MNKIIICIVACCIGYCAGYLADQKARSDYEFLHEANELKYELIQLQDEALLRVDTIFYNNNIYDGDGGDTMCDYLELRNKIDSLYMTQL